MRRAPSTHFARKVAVPLGFDPASHHRSPGAAQAIGREEEGVPKTLFEEGAHDTLDVDLRHRMISEMAYHLYRWRGCADGYDLEDWLKAETHIDNLARMRSREGDTEGRQKQHRHGLDAGDPKRREFPEG